MMCVLLLQNTTCYPTCTYSSTSCWFYCLEPLTSVLNILYHCFGCYGKLQPKQWSLSLAHFSENSHPLYDKSDLFNSVPEWLFFSTQIYMFCKGIDDIVKMVLCLWAGKLTFSSMVSVMTIFFHTVFAMLILLIDSILIKMSILKTNTLRSGLLPLLVFHLDNMSRQFSVLFKFQQPNKETKR